MERGTKTQSEEKPGSPEELVHFGIKGQKWGVRKEEAISSLNERTKEYISVIHKGNSKLTPKERKQNLEESNKKFVKKITGSDQVEDHRGLTPTQKKLLIGAGVVAGVAVVGAGAYYLNKKGKISLPALPGQHVSKTDYEDLMRESKFNSWDRGYITKESFLRPEMELPAGHTFHRFRTVDSLQKELVGRQVTYVSPDIHDYNRYLSMMTEPDGTSVMPLKHITFQSNTPIKVPNLTTTLDTLQEVMAKDQNVSVDLIPKDSVAKTYARLTGGDWDEEPINVKLVSALGKKGYGALVDEMDAGVISQSPLVLFHPSDMTQKIIDTSSNEIKNAHKGLTEIAYRK